MKKKIAVLLFGAAMALTLTACGKDKKEAAEGTEAVDSTEEGSAVTAASSAFDLDGKDYVKLCDFEKINVTITGDYDVDDDDVKNYFANMFEQYGPFYKEDQDKTKVGEGDIVNVDYVGKLDGEAFEGGTAKGQLINVDDNSSADGSSSFIEGFTDDLKGASVGDVIDSDVTFPEDYGNTDLAGKAVVFTFTVNSIQKPMTVDEVDDAFAKEQFQVDTVDAMYEQLKTALTSMAENSRRGDTYRAVQDYLLENCTVEVPQDYLAARISDYKRQFIQTYCEGDESKLEEYLSTYYGKTQAEMEEEWKTGSEQNLKLEFILSAISDKLGLKMDEEECASYIDSMVSSKGYESEDMVFELYGYGDKTYGEKYVRQLYLYDKALSQVVDSATVKEEAPAEDTEAPVEGTETLKEGTETADSTEKQD